MNTILNKITLYSITQQVRSESAYMEQKESVRIISVLKNCQFIQMDTTFCLFVQNDGSYIDEPYTITADGMPDMTVAVSSPGAQKSLYFKIKSTEIIEPRDMYFLIYMAINRLDEMEVVHKYDCDLSQRITEKINHMRTLRMLNERR